jgi:PTH1 family peptidyl-tRNA hydrolase
MIIVGLGNPGSEYTATRHNLGWLAIDALQQSLAATPWKQEDHVLWSRAGSHWLIKPTDFMNQSGLALFRFLNYKKIPCQPATDLVVIHDEIDLPVGELRDQTDRSSAGHQGVQSIIDQLGTQNFRRIRIGIGANRLANSSIPAEDYVLGKIPAEDQPVIDQTVKQVAELLSPVLTG